MRFPPSFSRRMASPKFEGCFQMGARTTNNRYRRWCQTVILMSHDIANIVVPPSIRLRDNKMQERDEMPHSDTLRVCCVHETNFQDNFAIDSHKNIRFLLSSRSRMLGAPFVSLVLSLRRWEKGFNLILSIQMNLLFSAKAATMRCERTIDISQCVHLMEN